MVSGQRGSEMSYRAGPVFLGDQVKLQVQEVVQGQPLAAKRSKIAKAH